MQTTNELIQDVKSRSLMSNNQNMIDDDTIIRLLNNECANHIVPHIQKYRQEYLIAETQVSVATNQDKVAIPTNALAGKIRSITILAPDGNELPLDRIEREDREYWKKRKDDLPRYYVEGNNIRLVPLPTQEYKLVIGYLQRPSKFTMSNNARQVTYVDVTNGIVRLNSAGASWLSVSTSMDVLNGDYPSEIRIQNAKPQHVDQLSKTIRFADISAIQVGDWIVETGRTPVSQIPDELNSLLVELVVRQVHQTAGDQQGVNNSNAIIKQMEENLKLTIADRTPADPVILINNSNTFRR